MSGFVIITRRTILQYGASYAFGAPIIPGNGAQYRLLLPHTFGAGFYDQGDIVTDGIDTPPQWVPTLAVDPLNQAALTQYYNAGPRGLGYESLNRFNLENYQPQPLPVTYWKLIGSGLAQLTGLGASLPPKVV